jgi:uncharacterized protein YndB with AHSA1/START domain
MEQVERSLVVRAPVGAVWRALTESGRLSAWFGGEVEVDPVPGGQLTVREDGRLHRAVVVDFEPGRRLAFRWLPHHHRVGFLWGEDEQPAGISGEVEITLAAVPGGTRVTVVERAPAGASPRALASAMRRT